MKGGIQNERRCLKLHSAKELISEEDEERIQHNREN